MQVTNYEVDYLSTVGLTVIVAKNVEVCMLLYNVTGV